MDVLDDILGTLDLKGALYFRTDFSAPWAVTVPDLSGAARFHLVVQGVCFASVAGGNFIRLGPGDMILIPRGLSHVLADDPGRSAPPLESVLTRAGYDGNGLLSLGDGDPEASTQLICGHFTFRPHADHPLLGALPDHIVITSAMRARQPWLDDMLRLVARRMFSGEMGSAAAVTRLSEIVFIEMLSLGIRGSDGLSAILDAFQDHHIGKALRLVHSRPGEPWTVDRLASEIGMSRSRFAERFRELIGSGPMAYLADWRLQKSLALLEKSRGSIQQIAAETGYQSPAAFSRAFANRFGITPLAYRKNPE
ncbi:MAG: AraC family transcriptional regulator [Rhodospirillales bacterium]